MLNISKKTKIVATIGPVTNTLEKVRELIDAGMNVMRINFSHGTYETHKTIIDISKKLIEEHIYIPIMLDTAGPEIRCHFFEDGKVEIVKDSIVTINMKEVLGTATEFSVNYPKLVDDILVGDMIKIDDGKLRLDVIEVDREKRLIKVKAFNTHVISNRKGINIPGERMTLPALSERDKKDIKFGIENGIDMIAASFTRCAADVIQLKNYLAELGAPEIPIIAKIENKQGVDNIKEILEVADGIMVARGDMGVDIPPEVVPVMQSDIILECRKVGKPVIVATQMLDSMQTNPLPTRAEVSDVATAIKEGADAVMLSAKRLWFISVESAAMQPGCHLWKNFIYSTYKTLV